MKYQEALREIKSLWGYSNIVVTGPQRSGTTLVAHALASDLGLNYIDEDDLEWVDVSENDLDRLRSILEGDRGNVIQAPACAHICHTFPNDVLIVFVRRNVEDIVASQGRIDWRFEDVEQEKYPEEYRASTIARTKYLFWEGVQRKRVRGIEVEYESLRDHRLWIDDREGFEARQWTTD